MGQRPVYPASFFGLANRADVAQLRGDRVAQYPGDPGDGHEQGNVRVVGTLRPEVPLAGVDLRVELVDEAQARGASGGPGLGDRKAREELPAPGPEEVAHRDRVAEGDEGGVDPVLEGRPVADEVKPEARSLALGPVGRVGQL